MVSDPRCPDCNGKVSSTATWCMHCGTDFPNAVDADSGRAVQGRADERTEYGADYENPTAGSSSSARLAGWLVALFGLVTFPIVTPPNTLLFNLTAVVAVGMYGAAQSSSSEAVARGGTAVAVAPLVISALAFVFPGFGQVSPGALLAPLVYAIVVSAVARAAG